MVVIWKLCSSRKVPYITMRKSIGFGSTISGKHKDILRNHTNVAGAYSAKYLLVGGLTSKAISILNSVHSLTVAAAEIYWQIMLDITCRLFYKTLNNLTQHQ